MLPATDFIPIFQAYNTTVDGDGESEGAGSAKWEGYAEWLAQLGEEEGNLSISLTLSNINLVNHPQILLGRMKNLKIRLMILTRKITVRTE
jgi:hydroxypyruvate isomerase